MRLANHHGRTSGAVGPMPVSLAVAATIEIASRGTSVFVATAGMTLPLDCAIDKKPIISKIACSALVPVPRRPWQFVNP
jgi:hypothetical protein